MKKVLILSIFSLLAFAPLTCALAQAGGHTPATKAVEKSPTGNGSATDERKPQDPSSEGAGAQAPSTNQALLPTLAETTEASSNVEPEASAEAQRNYNDGVALYDSGRLDEAINAFKLANKLSPNDPQVQYMLGMAYWKTKGYQDARSSFERAVRIKPDWAEAHYRLGLTFYVLGRSNKANEEYQKLLELNSPLAHNLHRINSPVKKTSAVEQPKAEPAASPSDQVELVPVSTSAPVEEKAPVTVGEPNGLSTTAASPDKSMSAVAPANEAPVPALSESNNAPPTATSSEAGTTSTTTPLSPAATGDSTSSNNGATAVDDSALTSIYKVGVGDVLDIRLLNSANRSTLYSVVDGGLIDLPIAGRPISVAGLTTKEIEALITSELKRLAVEQQTQVTVGVRQYSSHTVIITGLVGNPGTKTLRREAVPLYVLLAEVQPRLDAARAAIMRQGASTQVLELSDPLALHFFVRPGDVINLTARPQEFYYIAGSISYPGQKIFQPGITLVQAILAAGGMVRESVVELSREGSDGLLITTKLKLNEIKSGKVQDPKLQPGDRIEVFH